MPIDRKRLSSYLNDHLAGSTAGLELAGRALNSHRGTELGDVLERLRGEIQEDRRMLEELMEQLGVRKDPLKTGAAWVAEKVGRLKLNGSLVSSSPLSPLVELDGLTLAVHGKLALWQALAENAEEPELAGFDAGPLIERAHAQLEALEQQRRQAARLAFAPDS